MRKTLLLMLFLTITFLLAMLGAAGAQEVHEGVLLESNGVSLTVYNQGTALVQDRRTFDLSEGLNVVDFTDVAGRIDSTSVSFKSLTDPLGTVVLEQNFVYDLVNSSALLVKYLDEQIEVFLDDGTLVTGQLLSGRGSDIIVRLEDGEVRVISLTNVRNLRFPALPDALITRPTLRWLIRSAATGPQEVELTYLTGGVNWRADYSILLGGAETLLDLSGWVTLTNSSGAAFQNAQLKLIAGDVNRVDDERRREDPNLADRATPTAQPTEGPQVQQREFFEYQLYEVQRPVTVGDNETKQVEFVNASGVEATIHYVYDASPGADGYYYPIEQPVYGDTSLNGVQTWLEFVTGEESGLDADLPAGRVRVYQKDIDGANLFIRQDSINHTPNGEKVTLFLGNASDLVGVRSQTDFEIISGGFIFTYHVVTETYEIHLRNHKETQVVEVRLPERLFRWSNWDILSASHDYTQLDSATMEFRVSVPPGGETVITYTVQYSWPW